MHSRVYEVSTSKIPMYDRLTAKKIETMVENGTITPFYDYIVDITTPKIRDKEIKWLVDYLGSFQNIKGQLVISESTKTHHFKEKYKTFIEEAKALSEASFDDFKSHDIIGYETVDFHVYKLKEAYNETLGFYIYDRQEQEFMTLSSFIRKQKFKPHGSRTYWIGGVLDYHF